MSYAELDTRVERWRGGLRASGVGHGDRVVVVSRNDEMFVLAGSYFIR